MAHKKSSDNPLAGAEAEIQLAMYELALTGKNKKRKGKASDKVSGSTDKRIRLYQKMERGEASARELVYLSFLFGMIDEKEYAEYLQIEKACEESEEDDDESGDGDCLIW